MFPSRSIVRPCGPEIGVLVWYSVILPVLGSRCPIRLPIWPLYHIVPSGAARGSCGRVPGVGNSHSLIETLTGPGTDTNLLAGFSGKLLTRYLITGSTCSGVKAAPAFIIMWTALDQPAAS